MAVAAMMLTAVGTVSHEIQAQSKKATTPVEVAPFPLGPVKATPPPSASANLAKAAAPVGYCFTSKTCIGTPFHDQNGAPLEMTKDACQAAGGLSWFEASPPYQGCVVF